MGEIGKNAKKLLFRQSRKLSQVRFRIFYLTVHDDIPTTFIPHCADDIHILLKNYTMFNNVRETSEIGRIFTHT